MTRRRPTPTDAITPREHHALTAAIEKLAGVVEKLDQRLDAVDKLLIESRVNSHEPRITALEAEASDRRAIAKHTAKWRAAAYGTAGLAGAAIPHVIGYLR